MFSDGVDPFWADFKKQFAAATQDNGLTIVEDLSFSLHDKDFRTAMLKLKEKQPQAVLFGLDYEAAFIQFAKGRLQYITDVPAYGTEIVQGFAADEKFKGIMGGVRFVAPADPDNTFAEKYKRVYGAKPAFSASNAYDATSMVLEAIAAGNTNADSIKRYLETHEFNTVTFGRVHFDELGGIAGGKFVFNEIDAEGKVT